MLRTFIFPPEDTPWGRVMSYVRPIVAALVIAGLFRTFLYDPYRIPSPSMLPNLLIGDALFISRFAYGIHVPLTNRILAPTDPQPGDIVVFKKDLGLGQGPTNYIKRVVAGPGDRVSYRDKTLYVNGRAVQQQRLTETFDFAQASQTVSARVWQETLPNGVVHTLLKDPAQPAFDLPETTIPADQFIVLGDNRDHSLDTRFWNYPQWSYVDRQDIKGRAEIIYWSWDEHFVPRFDRLLQSLRATPPAHD